MKKTKFKGVVNGVEFDNVTDYNTAISKAIETGVLRSASSNTEVIEEPDEEYLAPEGEYTIFPYMDENDPYYLDLLITEDKEVNREALAEAETYFTHCAKYIKDILDKNDCTFSSNYKKDINDILSDIGKDKELSIRTLDKIKTKRSQLHEKFEAYRKHYDEEILKLDKKFSMLEDATKVIDLFNNFYKQTLAEASKKRCKSCGKSCTCGECECKCDTSTVTNVTEKAPQKEYDLPTEDPIKSIFNLFRF